MEKLRILCLHGYHGNAQVLRGQLAPLANGLDDLVEFVYVDAPSLAAGDFGWWHAEAAEMTAIKSGAGVDRSLKRYKGWQKTREAIVSAFARQGPFDGVFGFSQGAALASLLVGLRAHDGLAGNKLGGPESGTSSPSALTTTQIGALTTGQIGALSIDQVGALTAEQLGALSTSQFVALTTDDVAALSTHQIDALSESLSFDFAVMAGGFVVADADLACLYGERSNYDLPSAHIIGRSDSVVPNEASFRLASKFNNPLILAHEGGHVISNATQVRQGFRTFLEEMCQRKRTYSLAPRGA